MTEIPLPSRADVEATFTALIEGRWAREQAALWASTWFGAYEGVPEDMTVWDGLAALAGADAAEAPGVYVYVTEDFEDWRQEFLVDCAESEVAPT